MKTQSIAGPEIGRLDPTNEVTRLALAVAGVLALTSADIGSAQAASVSLRWDAVQDSRVAQYEVRYGTNSTTYQTSGSSLKTAASSAATPDLGPGTYFFAVRSCTADSSSCSSFSDPVTTTIAAAPAVDGTKPTISLSGTSPGGPTYTSAQTVTINATATDNVGVTKVEFYDGATLKGTDASAPYSYGWAITSADNGAHSWTAKAYDAAGNVATSSVLARTVDIASADTPPSTGSGSGSTGTAPTVDPVGLVAAYSFEEASGSTVSDASGKGNHGVISGAVRVANGRFGKALGFNGSNAWVTVNDSASLDLTSSMTLEAWVWPSASQSGWRTILMKEQDGNLAYGLWVDNLSPHSELYIGGAGKGLPAGQALPLNQWSHLAATYDGQYHRLYVNGVQVAQSKQTGAIQTSSQVLRIGGNSLWGEYFNGYIDEVRIYNRALTAAEVQAELGGTTATEPGLASKDAGLLEFGEVAIDHQWRRVNFKKTFVDPIVVARPLSGNDLDPAVVRIDRVDATGFSVRVQEWDYLDDYRGQAETVGYLVMEKGRHQLPDGAWVEAGRVNTSKTNAFAQFSFRKAFSKPPVVVTSVTSAIEEDAVTTRVRYVRTGSFQVGLREQEANTQSHQAENIDYIAWQVSAGEVDGVQYAVGNTGTAVNNAMYTLAYPIAFAVPPVLLADMQTTNNTDTATVRWQNKDRLAVDLWAEEEQSKDAETTPRAKEVVGYFLIQAK